MNSYEARFNELKQLTNQFTNKDLISDIEQFAVKWSETYSLISKFKNKFIYSILYFGCWRNHKIVDLKKIQ